MKATDFLLKWFAWLSRVDAMLFSIAFAITSYTSSVYASCEHDEYDAAAKEALTVFLKTKYGENYKYIDVDHPSLMSLDGVTTKIPPYSSAMGFFVRADQHRIGAFAVVVFFEHCTNKVLDSFELHSSVEGQKTTK